MGESSPGLMTKYPVAPQGDVVDSYHGRDVADPYRILEDADAPATRQWIAAEAALTDQFLAAIPARPFIHRRLTELWDYERFGLPRRVGTAYVYSKNSGLQNQGVVYSRPRWTGPAAC